MDENEIIEFISYLQGKLETEDTDISVCLGFLKAHIPLCVDDHGVYVREKNTTRYLTREDVITDYRVLATIQRTIRTSKEQKRALYSFFQDYLSEKKS